MLAVVLAAGEGARRAGGTRCRIGPAVYLETGCRIGAEAVLREAVVLRGATVPPRADIYGSVLAMRFDS